MLGRKQCLAVLKTARTMATSSSFQSRRRRALLFAPGHDIVKIRKAAALDLDAAVLDMEDTVTANEKDVARITVCEALNSLDFGTTERVVRVNSLSSSLLEEDVKSVLTNGTKPDIVIIPKLDTAEEAEMLNSITSKYSSEPIPIIFQTESAVGLVNLHAVIKTLIASSHLVPVAILFGAHDYTMDIGASTNVNAVVYARQKIVTYARGYHMQPLDMGYSPHTDLDGLKIESEKGFGFGFSGKVCIHPDQIPVIQSAFSPSLEQLEHARELIKSFDESQAAGKGAFSFRGKMIDRPTLLQAQNIVDMFVE